MRGREGITSPAAGDRPTESIITLDRFSLKSYILIKMRMGIILVIICTGCFFSLVPPLKVLSTKKLI